MMQIIYVILIALALLALGVVVQQLDKDARKEKALNDKRDTVTTKALANFALKFSTLSHNLDYERASREKQMIDLKTKLEKLEEKFAELPVAQFEEETNRMKAWNDGVDNILNYGTNVPKLNKEGLKHE